MISQENIYPFRLFSHLNDLNKDVNFRGKQISLKWNNPFKPIKIWDILFKITIFYFWNIFKREVENERDWRKKFEILNESWFKKHFCLLLKNSEEEANKKSDISQLKKANLKKRLRENLVAKKVERKWIKVFWRLLYFWHQIFIMI